EQDGCIFQGTVWENLFADDTRRGRARSLLDAMGFDKPLDYAVTAEAGNLSPGERQKLLLTRALLRETPFLALDEPLNNMDAQGIEGLLAQLQKRKRGLLFITHQALPLSLQTTVNLSRE
ncbi:MAG: ATP-binding cassette domain-containing protein, partial [Roseburia sp.]|nr:ATP-binding cassette domain-containing protein [Roseburia sp.]